MVNHATGVDKGTWQLVFARVVGGSLYEACATPLISCAFGRCDSYLHVLHVGAMVGLWEGLTKLSAEIGNNFSESMGK